MTSPEEQTHMIIARGLTKTYGEFKAVDGIDFEVRKGEAFGLLGPNGAGKSTTMKMIASVSKRTGGELTILGLDPNKRGPEIRAHLGVVPQQDNLDRELKVHENLYVYGRFFGLGRKFLKAKVEELLEFAQLTEKRNAKAEELSGGMKRRLTIARGLVNEPEILMLDEPTTGLDPQARHILWDRLFRLREHGVTLVITTHYMDEAERCDRIGIIDQGKIVAIDTPAALKASVGADIITLITADDPAARAELEVGLGIEVEETPDGLVIRVVDGEAFVPRIFSTLKVGVRSINVRRPSLDDVFLKYTGRALRDADSSGGLAANPMVRAFRR